jgi:hypothetical protein
MKADDHLCSRNAREEKGSLVVLLLAERARSEGARSTRAIEDQPGHPLKRETSKLGGSMDIVGRAQWKINQAPSLERGVENRKTRPHMARLAFPASRARLAFLTQHSRGIIPLGA